MAYAKRLNGKQRHCISQFEAVCGLEFMYQDDIDAGLMTFAEAWHHNVKHIDDISSEIQNINTNGAISLTY